MHNVELLLTLSTGFLAALALGYLTHRIGWSPMAGYLLAGILVGPHTPGFVANKSLADQLAEVGVILLMFGVGLHFHVKDLLAVRRVAVTGALLAGTAATLCGLLAARLAGWTPSEGVVFGVAISVSSTVVLTRVLSGNRGLHSPAGRIAIGWLVVEDLLAVFVLVLLPVIFSRGAPADAAGVATALGLAALKIFAFAGFTLLTGRRLLPWVLHRVAETNSRELFTLAVLAIALGIAIGSSLAFGISVALGAFLAGMVVGQSEFSARSGAEALPMRDAFAVMFFLSVGMLFDPAAVLQMPGLIAGALAVVLMGKPLAVFLVVSLLGYGSRLALGVAASLAQIGEFSFLMAALAIRVDALPETAIHPLVAASILSIMLNPLLYRGVPLCERMIESRPWLWRLLNPASARPLDSGAPAPVPTHRAIVVGYGPIGRAVARLLRERGIEPTIVERNMEAHRLLIRQGLPCIYGDANQAEVLDQAGVAFAKSLILSASGSGEATEAIRNARQLNPRIHIVVRADYLAQTATLATSGADEVFCSEGEVALALTGSILRHLGATPDQMDSERDRIRAELANPSR